MIRDRLKIRKPNNFNIRGSLTTSNIIKAGVALLAIFLVIRFVNNPQTNETDVVKVAKPHKSTEINKEFSFPLKNSEGEEVSQIKYIIESAELRDQIINQGKKATAVAGRDFLVLNIKITNDFDQSITIDTRDYIRLSTGGNEQERAAPNMHNDGENGLEVQAISTLQTRIGFSIDEGASDLVLFVGEIKGEKQRLEVNF